MSTKTDTTPKPVKVSADCFARPWVTARRDKEQWMTVPTAQAKAIKPGTAIEWSAMHVGLHTLASGRFTVAKVIENRKHATRPKMNFVKVRIS